MCVMHRSCDFVCISFRDDMFFSVYLIQRVDYLISSFLILTSSPSPPPKRVLYFRLKDSTIYNVSLAAPTVVNRMYPMMGKVANLSNMVYQQATNALLWANLNASTIEMFFLANQSIRVIASNVKRITGMYGFLCG